MLMVARATPEYAPTEWINIDGAVGSYCLLFLSLHFSWFYRLIRFLSRLNSTVWPIKNENPTLAFEHAIAVDITLPNAFSRSHPKRINTALSY